MDKNNDTVPKRSDFRIWKSGKKWFVSSGAIIITLFGPTNVVGAAEVIANATMPEKETSSSVLEASSNTDENTLPIETSFESSDMQEISQEEISSEEQLIEETEISEEELLDTRLSSTVLDMNPSTEVAEDKISYSLTSDGNGWPDSAPNAKQLKISTGFSVGDVLVVKLGKGVSITEPGAPAGITVEQKVVNGETQITYTSNVSITTASFDISYYFPKQADNQQFMPGDTTIPVTVESGVKTLTGSIIATNPINTTVEARTHNTVVKNNVYTADGISVYNFVMGVKTTPNFTNFSSAVTQAIRAKGSGVIHVPEGFVLKGASLANYEDTDSNVPTDGSAIPGIPAGLAQPGGSGTDIIVSDVIIAGYNSIYNESFMYLYGYFEKGTPDGTYHFSPDLTLTPQYFEGSKGSVQVDTGSLADITLGKANPGSMVPSYAGVLEYHSGAVDTDHAGFYSKSLSTESGVSGFVTGKLSDTNINGAGVRPNVSIQFQDDTVNQTNTLKDYKLTLPDKWCGNLTDLSFSTDRNGIVSNTGNENKNGPFTVSLDNGQTFTVSAVGEEDQAVSEAIASGAHIVSVSGQADILAGNNLQSTLTNAVIEDDTYKDGDKVPIQLDVHSVTSNTDATAIGHLYYFDKQVSSISQFSIKNTLDYNIAGTYTQGQTFKTGSKWTLLNRETSSEDSTGKIILPVPNATADVKLPTLVISSVDKGMIDLDQSKIDQWGWTYDGKKYLPEIKDLGKDATTGEHLTELDFSQYTVTVPADINPEEAFMYPEALPWKVSDTAGPATGTTTHWITQLTDNNKDDLHPVYGGNIYDGSIGQRWTITVPGSMQEKIGLSGNRTGSTNFYTSATGMAGFDRGLTADIADDVNAGQVMLSLTNGFKETYSQVQTVVVLPSKDAGDVFTMVATGPVTNLEGGEAKAIYSTKIYEVPADEANEAIDLTTNDWVAEDQVTDWSTIRSVAITAKSLEGESVLAGYVPVAIDKIETTKIGDIAEVQSWAHAKGPVPGSDINKNTPMKAQIYGTPQIKAHYEETTDGSTSNGTVLAEEVTITGENTNGTDPEYGEYKTNKKDIPGFTYKGLAKNSAPETGTLTDNTADVVYLYEREEQELQVHYMNISGSDKAADWAPEDGVEIKESLQILTGKSGEEYTNELVIPKGYDLVTADPGATKGTFDTDSEVTQHEYVYVKAQQQKVIYNVIDDTIKKTIESEVLFDEGDTDTDLNKKQEELQKIADSYIPKGYEVVSVDSLPEKFDNDSSVDQLVEIHLAHALIPVDPENPGEPGEPIDPTNPEGPKWPEGTDKESLLQSITRTIEYLDKQTEDVVAKQVVQTVAYTRTGIVDKVTGELLGYDTTGDGKVDVSVSDEAKAWMTENKIWEGVTSPDLTSQGYGAPSIALVEKTAVEVTDKDSNVKVYYDKETPTDKQGQKVTVNYIDTDGKEISDSIILEGKIGDKYESEQKTIKGYTFVKVEGNATGEFTDKEQKVTYIYSKETTEKEETENPKTGSNDKGAGTTSHGSNSASTTGKVFPKTGEDMQLSAKLMELGMVVIAATTGAYLFLKKKVKK